MIAADEQLVLVAAAQLGRVVDHAHIVEVDCKHAAVGWNGSRAAKGLHVGPPSRLLRRRRHARYEQQICIAIRASIAQCLNVVHDREPHAVQAGM